MRTRWLLLVLAAGIAGAAHPGLAQSTTPTAAPTPPAKLDRDPHLIARWEFEETSGKRATDGSSKAHHGTLEGALAFETHSVAGRHGRALKFEGNDHGVRIDGFKGVTGPAPRTLALWLKTTAPGGDLVAWGTDEHGQMWRFTHIRDRVGVTPKGGYLYMKTATHDDAWHHVAVVVRDASPPNLHDDVALYLDGQPAVIDDIGLLDLWPIETGDQREVTLGRRFKGCLDDVRLYDRALTDEEILTLFQAPQSQ